MATVYYTILNGAAPFTATLQYGDPPYDPILVKSGLGLGENSFTDVPDGNYIIAVEDSLGCYDFISPVVYCPTITTTTTCEPTDCECSPSFDTYVTPSIGTIDVGELIGCEYDDYVIDWYDDEDNIKLTTAKTFAHNSIVGHSLPNVDLIHPLTGASAVYMPIGIYTARIRYVIIDGVTYYPDSPSVPCRIYCPGLNIDLAIIEITSIECGETNITNDYYDYETSYSPTGNVSYKTYSYFTIELASDGSSGYLGIYMKPEVITDTIWVYWGNIEDDVLIDMYKSGTGVSSSSEGVAPYASGSEKMVSGDERKVVVSFIDKTYSAGQILTVKIESNVNTNTKWLYRFKCLSKTDFPEITNYFPLLLRKVDDIVINSVTRSTTCVYTINFTLPNSGISGASGLWASNFYNYNTIYQTPNQGFNYLTGQVAVSFKKGDYLVHGAYWGMGGVSNFLNNVGTPNTSGIVCDTTYDSTCNGFHYKWDHLTKSLKFTVNPNYQDGSGRYGKFYYGLKDRYLYIMGRAIRGDNGTSPYNVDPNTPGHYHGIDIYWYNSVISGGTDLACGDQLGDFFDFYFHFSCVVKIMGITIDPNASPSPFNSNGTLNATIASAITAQENLGGADTTIKTIEFFAADPGGLSYTTTTTTTDENGYGSCDTRSSDLYTKVIHGGAVNRMRDIYNLVGKTGGLRNLAFNTTWEGRSICSNYGYANWIFTSEIVNDETIKWVAPAYNMLLKSLADRTCSSLIGWKHDAANVVWKYYYYIAYLKITCLDIDNIVIEDYLDHNTGEILPTGTVIYSIP